MVIFLGILVLIFGIRFYFDYQNHQTIEEQNTEIQKLRQESGAITANYRYTVKEPENIRSEWDTTSNFSEVYVRTQENYWQILKSAQYEFKNGIYRPIFSEDQQRLANKKLIIKGFMIPLEEQYKQQFFLLSYFPYSMCFFCGQAEPQTVIEVTTTSPVPYQAEPIQVEGILHLNSDNPNRLFYFLKDAEIVD